MTARQLYEYALIELNKVEAPSLLLEDYNYFINKAIMNYINKRYNVYDANQQTTDDLRVLKGTVVITNAILKTGNALQGATYIGTLPDDYFHILNCIVGYSVAKPFKCYETTDTVYMPAVRLTADMYSQIINNAYLRPTYKRPYFYIHNSVAPTITENDMNGNEEKADKLRDGNTSPVKIEVRYGKDNTLFVLTEIQIDYLKVPRWIKLTQTQIDTTEDLSTAIEFPDYVCQEIIKELVTLLMENASDPRLQSNPVVNQTIAPPQGSQQQPQQAAHKR